ncbi:hypothetical protein TRFO_23443 [Tritrichomonas foetus]|uniref:Uncharacterized protein n=1 Tax=Tritrichomonas foetus TaxID=1144522 RepID=A0A1J4KEY7_9EUKA|nr:hypothetical protein TRFO_23443 [Tritrichomonas foetus]|eukprot:OHT08158.1 hypothetical protein TRFO_23443 [Tritrichomonas foetus]
MLLFIILQIKTKISSYGVTTIDVTADSTIDVNLDKPDLYAYILFSSFPKSSYINSLNRQKVSISDTLSFISDQSLEIFSNQSSFSLTVWILSSDLCGLQARAFKGSQMIFARWDFTQEINQTCFFPLNKGPATVDLTILKDDEDQETRRASILSDKSDENNLTNVLNLTQNYSTVKLNNPFFIFLESAGKDTILSYSITFSKYRESENQKNSCFDEQMKYFDDSQLTKLDLISDLPQSACSSLNYFIMIEALSIFVLVVIAFVLLFIVCMSCCKRNNSKLNSYRKVD